MRIAGGASRGFKLLSDRGQLLVQDEIEPAIASDIAWTMHIGGTTTATLRNGGTAVELQQNGKRVTASLLGTDGAVFAIEDTTHKFNATTNFRKLVVRRNARTQLTTIAVLFTKGAAPQTLPAVQPIANW